MNLAQTLAVSSYLSEYPHNWTFKQLVEHMYYDWDDCENSPVKIHEYLDTDWGEKIGWLIQRKYILIANAMEGNGEAVD